MRIVDGQVVERARPERVSIYFIQAVSLQLIKIGRAEDLEKRVRQLALSGPDKLNVLGYQFCDQRGALEAELHERFADFRLHGEWFRPDRAIIQHVNSYAVIGSAYLDRLNAIARFPTMKRGRPDSEMRDRQRVAGVRK